MRKIQRWTLRHRAAVLAVLLVALATVALAAGRNLNRMSLPAPAATTVASPAAQNLSAPLPPPAQVLIQRTTAFPNIGNVLVTVQLTADEIAAKQADGTQEFVTLGNPDEVVILRDDGAGGDAVAGDGLYTGIASIDDAALQARASADQAAIAAHPGGSVPVFAGRTNVGSATPRAFDFTGYNAGRAVAINPAVVFLGAESQTGGAQPQPKSSQGLVARVVVPGTDPFQEHVLMIRDLSVVQDPTRTWNPCTGGNPNGVWTFNHLMTNNANQAASGIDPAIYTEKWLANWPTPPTINGHTVSTRNNPLILNNWPLRADGHLDLTKAPFRLLAIVSRVDLRRTTGGGGGYTVSTSGNFIDGGEARFVFGLETGGCTVQPYTVIFEYRVPKCGCEEVRAWAKQWVNLNAMPFGAAYNAALQNITEQFAKANANPARPNGSALGQQRTNEIALAAPWELREFQLTQFPFSMLNETTTADTAIDSFNNTATFKSWVQTKVEPPLTPPLFQNPIPPVPLFFPTIITNFLGSNPQAPAVWNAPGLNLAILKENWARHRASLATCNSCHTTETATTFTHVDPLTPLGLRANLSGFLTGISVVDPVFGSPTRDFDDLARRETDIVAVAGMTCGGMVTASTAIVTAALASTGHLPPDIFGISGPVPSDRVTSVAVDDMKRNLVFEVH
ncbi:MAG TPA: choice-of-anchor X domain-containing protein [Thermoanaerobaculia bacterium]|nr:choice-of-anchor X domain-containing protein [Thermoanaerobaculia bacterium]